ncbi:MAG: hypothetical protein R3E97_06650 [Candidatus Eisenbacteria bacterium]
MKRTSKNSIGRSLCTVVGALTLGSAFLLSGCGDSETSDLLGSATSDTALASETLSMTSFTTQDLPTELELTAQQESALSAAIEELESARAEMKARFEANHPVGGGRGGRAAGGPDGGRRGGPVGGGMMPDEGFVPPMMTFLSTAADILDRDQFVILAQYLAENRPARPDRGDRPDHEKLGERFGRHLAEELGLSDEQIESFRTVVSSYREQFRDLREAVRDEEMGAAEALSQALTLAGSMKTELAAILTADQLSAFQELKAARMAEGIERRIDNLDERMTQRAEFVAAVLDMDDAQTAQTLSIFQNTVTQRTEILNGLKDGSIDPEVAAFRLLVIEKDAWDAVYAILTPEQQESWEALKDMLPVPHGRF